MPLNTTTGPQRQYSAIRLLVSVIVGGCAVCLVRQSWTIRHFAFGMLGVLIWFAVRTIWSHRDENAQ